MNKDSVNCLKKVKEKCRTKEPIIEYYADCLLKLTKAYNKIEKTEMLHYVKQIVDPSFQLVIIYFSNCVDKYLDTEEPEEKMFLLNDIQLSVESYLEVWETIIQSTNTADRILIQSVPVGPIRQIPVKICAYFTNFLEALTKLFIENEQDSYAFLVYPSFGKRPEARLLFSTVKENGKVGIIRVPEKDIWNITYLRMLICHEVFHIIPRDLRDRFERSKSLEKIITTDLKKRMWHDIEAGLSGKEKLEEKQKKGFEEVYFGEISCDIYTKLINRKDKNDRSFYSTEILQYYSDHYISHFLKKLEISTNELWNSIYGSEQPISTFDEYQQRMEALESIRMQMSRSILQLLAHSRLPAICSFYMDVFREVFSDLTSILSNQISAEEYFTSFRYTPLQDDDFQLVPDLYLRAGLVLRIMTENDSLCSEGVFENWREWKKHLEDKLEGNGVSFQEQVIIFLSILLENDSYENTCIMIFKSVWRYFESHFRIYRDRYLNFEAERKESFRKFRERYSSFLGVTNFQLLQKISEQKWEFEDISDKT